MKVDIKNTESFFGLGQEIMRIPLGTMINGGLISNDSDFSIFSENSCGGSAPTHFKILYSDRRFPKGSLQKIAIKQMSNLSVNKCAAKNI